MIVQLSPHLSLTEFTNSPTADRLGIDNSLPDSLLPHAEKFALYCFEPVREAIGGPLHVNSGYRSLNLNEALPNSSKTSQHMFANAIDILPTTMSLVDGFRKILESTVVFDQLMIEGVTSIKPNGSWIHVSYNTQNDTPQRNQIKIVTFNTGSPVYHTVTREDAIAWCNSRS